MKITNWMRQSWIICFLLATAASAGAAPLTDARVSQVFQDVSLLAGNAAPRRATVNDNIHLGTAVRTGTQSRAELTFTDLTITRLGENTIFSLKEGTRELTIDHGSILVQVPSGAPAANIRTAAVTAAISGGTAIFGAGPPAKFMVLEGVGTFYPAGHPEDAVTLHGGEMVSLGADGHLVVQTFNVKLVLETSPLITQFPDLANLPLIFDVQVQQDQSNPGTSPPPSKDIIDTTSQNTDANPTVNQPPPSASATPIETGPPPTITTPNPYVIGSGTTIQTDPTITTGGVTNNGTFYRGTALDGTPTQFLFGQAETSFDQMVFTGVDNHLPVAVFKFSNLELTGNPTVIIPSGGTTNLALVAVGTITSGGPGGTLTFAGISRLSFITGDGSINLGSEISFSGIDHLEFYARGAGSNLTLASSISGGSNVHLNSEGSTQVNGDISVSDTFTALTGGDFLAGTGTITATNVDILSLNNLNFNLSQFANPADSSGTMTLNSTNTLNLNLDREGGFGWSSLDASAQTINITAGNPLQITNTGQLDQGGTITLIAGGNLTTTGGDLDLYVNNNSGAQIGTGGNIVVTTGGDLSASGAVNLILTNAGTVTTGGNVTLTVGSNVDAQDVLTAGISNTNGQIGGAASVTANITGNLTTQGGVNLFIGNGVDAIAAGAAGGTIGGGATVNFTANDVTITPGGSQGFNGFSAELFNDDGATINGNAQVSVTGHDFNVADSFFVEISNDDPGSLVSGNAALNLTANSITLTDSPGNAGNGFFEALLANESGAIQGAATINVNVAGQISADFVDVEIDNRLDESPELPGSSATIGSDATITLQAGQITGGGFFCAIDNAPYSSSRSNSPGGGQIVGNAAINLTVGSFSGTNQSVDVEIDNNAVGDFPGGQIGGNATISLNTGSVSAPGGVFVLIDNDSGTIGGDANLTVNAANITTGPVAGGPSGVDAEIDNRGGTIGGNATVNVTTTGDINTNGGFDFFDIHNAGGSIGAAADILVSIGGNYTSGRIEASIDNSNGGAIGSGANITFDVAGNVTSATSTFFGLYNGGGTIPTGGDIAASIGGNLTTGSLSMFVDNSGGGQIGTSGNMSLTTGGDLTTSSGGINFTLQNTGGSITSGGNITLGVGGSVSTQNLDLFLQNYDFSTSAAGSIGTGGNLSVTVGGDVSATSIDAYINNRSGGMIGSGGNLTFTVGGALTTSGDAGFIIANRYDSSVNGSTAGSVIGSDVALEINAASVNIGGALEDDNFTAVPFTGIINRGGTIDGNASYVWNVSGDLTVQGDADMEILNGANSSAGAPTGGTIHGSATLQVNATNFAANSLFARIDNKDGGAIDSDAILTFNLTGNFSTPGSNEGSNAPINPGDAYFEIQNNLNPNGVDTGGSIGESALLTINALDMSAAGDFQVEIANQRSLDSTGSSGGSIGGDAILTFTAASLSVGGELDVFINNRNNGSGPGIGGHIGGDATLTFTLAGDLTTTGLDANSLNGTPGDAIFQIDNENLAGGSGGYIGGSASVSVAANNISTAGQFNTAILNFGGEINGDATVTIATGPVGASLVKEAAPTGQLNVGSAATFFINNIGGTIGGGASVDVSASSISTDVNVEQNSLFARIDNSSGGLIGNNAFVSLSASGNVTSGEFVTDIQNGGGIVGSLADVELFVGGSLNVTGAAFFGVGNSAGTIGQDAIANASVGSLSASGDVVFGINNQSGEIGESASLTLNASGDVSSGGNTFFNITNASGTIGSGASVMVNAANLSSTGSFQAYIDNTGGLIGEDAIVDVAAGTFATSFTAADVITGNLTANDVFMQINNTSSGLIGGVAHLSVNLTGDLTTTAGDVTLQILNTTGSIGGGVNTSLNVNGSANVSGVLQMLVENYDFSGNAPGSIGGGADISLTTGGDLTAQSIIGLINNRSGGGIGANANLIVNVGGALTTTTDSTDPFGFPDSVFLVISNRFDNTQGNPAGASTIDGDATLEVNAGSASIGGELRTDISNSGSTLNGNALLEFSITNNMTVQNEADLDILNDADGGTPNGGTIHGSATLQVSANDFTANALFAFIDNRRGGVIDSDATITFNLTGNLSIPGTNPGNSNFDSTVPGEADFYIWNQRGSAAVGGFIGGNASISLSAATISTAGLLDPTIINNHATIVGNATIEITTTGSIVTSPTGAGADLGPNDEASPGPNDIVASSMDVEINNVGGSIGGNETVTMNVAHAANISGDATFAITGNDPTGAAAINFNGGNYIVGGNFRSTIDGNGAINFTNANIQGTTVKAGVFGTDGTLMIGGGSMLANQELKLYASGSNGSIEFTANVTLNCAAAAIVLAANKITIDENVVVTIAGSFAASVYANIANYSVDSGGNGNTNGLFAGAGANRPQPLGNAPPFDNPPTSPTSASSKTTSTVTSSTNIQTSSSATVASSTSASGTSRRGRQSSLLSNGLKQSARNTSTTSAAATTSSTIKVADSGQLLSLLDSATPTSNGNIMITSSKGDGVSSNSSRSNPSRSGVAPGPSHAHSAVDNPNAVKTPITLAERATPSVR